MAESAICIVCNEEYLRSHLSDSWWQCLVTKLFMLPRESSSVGAHRVCQCSIMMAVVWPVTVAMYMQCGWMSSRVETWINWTVIRSLGRNVTPGDAKPPSTSELKCRLLRSSPWETNSAKRFTIVCFSRSCSVVLFLGLHYTLQVQNGMNQNRDRPLEGTAAYSAKEAAFDTQRC